MHLPALHPITVHFPIVFPFIFIVLTAIGLTKYGTKFPYLENATLAFGIAIFTSNLAAYWTGERDAFGSAADPDSIARHAQAAKYFLILSGVSVMLAGGLRFLPRAFSKFSQSIKVTLFLVSLGLVGLAIWTGHLGGELVY